MMMVSDCVKLRTYVANKRALHMYIVNNEQTLMNNVNVTKVT